MNSIFDECVGVKNELMMHACWFVFSHKDTSSVDPVELCACLTSAVDKRRLVTDHADQFGHTPLHLAARRGAGVCAIHLIQVLLSNTYLNYLSFSDNFSGKSVLFRLWGIMRP